MRVVLFLAVGLAGCDGCKSGTSVPPPEVAAAVPDASPALPSMPAGWLKGQLHAHSSMSGDSNTSPTKVHRWYERHGFDFVIFTDHNAIADTPDTARTLTIPGVELTWNRTGAFHLNALFVDGADAGTGPIDFGDVTSTARPDVYRHELRLAKALGGIAMMNHPNMRWGGSDEALVVGLARQGLTLLEVRNESWDSNNAGDATHESTEALWDAALLQRLPLFASATDDAHHYDDAAEVTASGERPFTGDLGFVAVHAAKDTASIRAAIARGDFYASTGVVLTRCDVGAGKITLAADAFLLFETIGKGGTVLRQERGDHLEEELGPTDGPYLRVRITRPDGAKAWTQAVFGG